MMISRCLRSLLSMAVLTLSGSVLLPRQQAESASQNHSKMRRMTYPGRRRRSKEEVDERLLQRRLQRNLEHLPRKKRRRKTAEMKAIYDSIPTIRAPTPPPRDPETKKFTYDFAGGNANKEPLGGGTKVDS